MKKRDVNSRFEALMALLMFGIFAACASAVLLMGAKAYGRLTQRDNYSYTNRTCVQYITTKINQSDALDAVSVGKVGSRDCICLYETIDGEQYITRIYCYKGYIREIFSADGLDFELSSGEPVIEAEELSASLVGSLLSVSVTADGETTEFDVYIRSGEGAA